MEGAVTWKSGSATKVREELYQSPPDDSSMTGVWPGRI